MNTEPRPTVLTELQAALDAANAAIYAVQEAVKATDQARDMLGQSLADLRRIQARVMDSGNLIGFRNISPGENQMLPRRTGELPRIPEDVR